MTQTIENVYLRIKLKFSVLKYYETFLYAKIPQMKKTYELVMKFVNSVLVI